MNVVNSNNESSPGEWKILKMDLSFFLFHDWYF